MDVAEYLTGLQHPRKTDIQGISAAILGADPEMSETIKWNAPNYVFAGEDRVRSRLQPGEGAGRDELLGEILPVIWAWVRS